MVIVKPINIQIAKPVMIEFGMEQRRRFLIKSNMIMFDIKTKKHTQSV